jgi:hypothetical protein
VLKSNRNITWGKMDDPSLGKNPNPPTEKNKENKNELLFDTGEVCD